MVGAQHKETTMNVKDRQCLLTFLKKADGTSYYTGEVDGIYGRLSRKAIQDFQKDFGGLAVTGEADAVTDQAMIHAVAFGIPERDQTEDNEDVTDNNVGGNDQTGTFWDDIKYFSRNESGIACPCGRCGGFPVEPSEKLMRLADKVREHFNAPMTPSSTVRCQAHNDELPGSAPNSYHVKGKAMDFSVRGFAASSVLPYVRSLGVHYAYAIDSNYVHMDVE